MWGGLDLDLEGHVALVKADKRIPADSNLLLVFLEFFFVMFPA